MSKASDRWIRERYYLLMGLETPADKISLQQFNNTYYTDFLIPATFIVSGKSKEEFDFSKVSEINATAVKYLADMAGGDQINQLISILYRLYPIPVWMLFLKDLVDVYEYTGLLSQSLRNALDKYMETHSIAYATYSQNATDIQIVVDKGTGKPLSAYPEKMYIYSEDEVNHYNIKHGSNTVLDVCEKPWYQYDAFDRHLIDNMTYDVTSLLYEFETPVYDRSNGEIVNMRYTYLSSDKPPAEVAELLRLLPSALVDVYGDPINALAAYVKNNPSQLTTEEAKQYISEYERLYASAEPKVSSADVSVKLPEPVYTALTDTVDTTTELQKLGYVVRDGADVIRDYMTLNELSGDITVNDLIHYMEDDTEKFHPKPFDKSAYAKEVIDGFDWDKVKQDAIASVDKQAIVREELSKVGVDADTLSRITIAMTTGTKAEISPTNYVDKFEEAGAVMLHGVREVLSKDACLENRQRVQDVIYAYLVVMMGEEKKLDTVVDFVADKREKAQGDAKELMTKAMEVLQKR